MKTLTKQHQSTYDSIFFQPMAHNLRWQDVRSMLGEIADVDDQGNGNFKATCGKETVILHAGHDAAVTDAEELITLRQFLEDIGG